MRTDQSENNTISVSSLTFPLEEELNQERFQGIDADSDTIANEVAGVAISHCPEENDEEVFNSLERAVSFKDAFSKLSSEEILSLMKEEFERRNEVSLLREATSSLLYTQTGHTGTQEEFMSEELLSRNASLTAIAMENEEFELTDQHSYHKKDETVNESCKSFQKNTCKGKIKSWTDTSQKLKSLISMDPSTSKITKDSVSKLENAIKQQKNKKLAKRRIEIFREKQEVLQKLIVDNSTLDVVFLVDCTKSMEPYINQTKGNVEHVVDEIKRVFENEVKVAFVGYRDHKDGPNRVESLPFTDDVDRFKDFVSNISASGGKDTPEDVFGGLEAAVNLGWSSKNRILFHVADAPQHGERFHDLGKYCDDYFYVDPRGLQIENLIEDIKELKVRYLFTKINSSTDKMIEEFNSVAGYDIVEYINMKSPNLIGEYVVNAASGEIHSSVMETIRTFQMVEPDSIDKASGSGRSIKKFSICRDGPDNVAMNEPENAYLLECFIPLEVKNLYIKKRLCAIKHRWRNIEIKAASQPFAQGAQRITFHGKARCENNRGAKEEKVVLKEFKFVGIGRDRRDEYISIMETQYVASLLAAEFNNHAPETCKRIKYLQVGVVQVFTKDGTPKYYNLEDTLPDYRDSFHKWNGNCGYVNEENYSAVLDAFSHWTYKITKGFLIIVDLQGVEQESEYILTDPSIHSKAPKYGTTNLGEFGIKQFFKTHKCGMICEAMDKETKDILTRVAQVAIV